MSSIDRQKKIIRDLPDVTAARQEQSLHDFRDTVKYFNQQMYSLGLCDGNKCIHHKIVGAGYGRETCYCRRAMNATNLNEKRSWQKMHFENCSAGRSMEKNLGCKGFEPVGMPLYHEKVMGRKLI